MTYRKLYLWILVTFAVFLMGVWWVSLRTYAGFFLAPGASHGTTSGGIICTLTPATFTLGHAGGVAWPEPFAFGATPLAQFNYTDSPEGARLSQRSRWGSFQIGRQNPIGVPPDVIASVVEFPVWLPWFFLAAAGYPVMRRMENRSKGMREKQLAETALAGPAAE